MGSLVLAACEAQLTAVQMCWSLFTLDIFKVLQKQILPQAFFIELMEGHSDGSCEQPLLEAGRETTPEKHNEISLCTQGPAGALCRNSLLKDLYCFILIKNIYLSLEEVEACPGLLCFGCKDYL